jgi:hypothetical protein
MTNDKKQRPTKAIYDERINLEQQLNAEWNDDLSDQHLNILNNYDWSTSVFQEGDMYGLKMWDDAILLPAEFDNFKTLNSEELNFGYRVVANINNKEGVVLPEKNGWSWLLNPEFDYITYPNDIVAVKKGEKWGIYCFSKTKYLIPIECEMITIHSGFLIMNGIGQFKKDGLWGIISDSGEYTEAIYNEVEDDIEGPVKVKLGEKWGYVKEDLTFSENEDDAYFWYSM